MTSKQDTEGEGKKEGVINTTVKLHLNQDQSSGNYLHQPIPKKPSQLKEGDLVNKESKTKSAPAATTTTSNPNSSTSSSNKKLPSLVVKQDPNLKSCLSQTKIDQSVPAPPPSQPPQPPYSATSQQQLQQQLETTPQTDQHPQFVSTDAISPIQHGLAPGSQLEEYMPLGFNGTPIISSQGSATSSLVSPPPSTKPALSPPVFSPSSSNSQQQQQQQLHPPPQSLPQQTSQPGVSRMNSLTYSSIDDKKFIESTRQSANTSANEIRSHDEDAITSSDDNKLHLLIGITGCISIHKNIFLIIEKLFELYSHDKLEIQVLLTKSAEYILSEKLHKFDEMGVKVWFSDDGEKYFLTSPFQKVYSKAVASGQLPIKKQIASHVFQQYNLSYDLQRWTDVLLLAPLSANTMAKLINGLADNLLTELLHVWPMPQIHHVSESQQPSQQPSQVNSPPPPPTTSTTSTAPVSTISAQSQPQSQQQQLQQQPQPQQPELKKDTTILSNNLVAPKPIVAALALTNSMYSHPMTKKQLSLLQETYPNMTILKPVEKCVDMDGNIAMGGMRSWREVVDFVSKKLGPPQEDEDEEGGDKDDNDEEEDEEEEQDDDDDDDDDDESVNEELTKSANKTEPTDLKKKTRPRTNPLQLKSFPKQSSTNGSHKLTKEVTSPSSRSQQASDYITGGGSSSTKTSERRRGNTITRRELAEHERLASQNALLNTGIGKVGL
ncbi:hypothetical protein I9W82_001168 [Candida metapsilosis]|uniref:Flavoprotein domain-containing protein n=1 Tax=Candida metapsilosis TaxID=273372 RepID=A0A8H8DEA8_9ASCO|nr:hypothetical protein I9W82_001168 [Candida metapsilosis]